jgi:hypothetical protein
MVNSGVGGKIGGKIDGKTRPTQTSFQVAFAAKR